MERKSERQHDHAQATEGVQGAQESAQASSESQASSGQSEEQSLPSDHLKNQIQPQKRKKILRWAVLDISYVLDDWRMQERRRIQNERVLRRRGWHLHNKLLVVQLSSKENTKKFSYKWFLSNT